MHESYTNLLRLEPLLREYHERCLWAEGKLAEEAMLRLYGELSHPKRTELDQLKEHIRRTYPTPRELSMYMGLRFVSPTANLGYSTTYELNLRLMEKGYPGWRDLPEITTLRTGFLEGSVTHLNGVAPYDNEVLGIHRRASRRVIEEAGVDIVKRICLGQPESRNSDSGQQLTEMILDIILETQR